MVEGLAPPTRAVVHSHETICRRLRIQYASLHMCGVNQFWIIVFFTAVKPANNILFCIELIQRPESSLRRHKLGLTDQSILSRMRLYASWLLTSPRSWHLALLCDWFHTCFRTWSRQGIPKRSTHLEFLKGNSSLCCWLILKTGIQYHIISIYYRNHKCTAFYHK